MTDPISSGPALRLPPPLEPVQPTPETLAQAAPEQARAQVDALAPPQLAVLREQVDALPLAERQTLANDLAGRLDAGQLRKLETAFGRDTIAAAVERGASAEVREAYAALPREGGDADSFIDTLKDALGLNRASTGANHEISAVVTNPDSGEINDATWTVDAQGRPVHAEATLRTVFSKIERSDAETDAQRAAADRGVDGDQGGHVFGHRFVTDQGLKNLFPQNGNFNMGAYKTLENEWAAWVDKGMDVRIQIDLTPRNVDRPDRVRISYEVIDPSDGGRVYDQRVSFDNRAGQHYDRVDAPQMDQMIAASA
ncbi:DNA/RNA non-specific endonuclease [Pseudomonas sp. CGJS7]|uniref:DNA/RNA non-specific endonuclease n=1 Tax=Pseudomonas sp. CGJS7 TaxID=3109348 RepID=UPI00300BC9BD